MPSFRTRSSQRAGSAPVAEHGAHHDQLVGDALRLGEEAHALRLLEVAVEEAREEPAERVVRERQLERVALYERDVRQPAAGLLEHVRALVERDDLAAAQMLREEPGAAGDVERARRRERLEERRDLRELFIPAGPIAILELPTAEPPVVVLGRAGVVVLLHSRSLLYPFSERA